ncbi:MAG: SAM-dependent methyltransferase [Anaerolineae bacterium]|nr:SAM-dependent methyltransferase [Anaerolineae bacterium]
MEEFRPTDEALTYLLSPAGAALLERLSAQELDEADALAHVTRLRKEHPPEVAAAALDLVLLRQRARSKFSRADRMFFTREALEQASAEVVSRRRAARYARYGAVADLCCGIGGDALALAARGDVLAVDLDPLRLRMARANAGAYDLGDRIDARCADVTAYAPPAGRALWADPSRRAGGKRIYALSAYKPALPALLSLAARAPGAGIKLSPGVDYRELERIVGGIPHEVELISVDGEAREAVLWLGELRTARRRATLLPAGHTLTGDDPDPEADIAPGVGDYLYEPDAAVIRAHLVRTLAAQIGARQIDPQIAYLTADRQIDSPFVTGYQVLERMPFGLKRIRARLRAYDVGELAIKKRGIGIDPAQFWRRLPHGEGRERVILIVTRVRDRPTALICRSAQVSLRSESGADGPGP